MGVELFFSHSVFDWIQIIVAVAGVFRIRNTLESS